MTSSNRRTESISGFSVVSVVSAATLKEHTKSMKLIRFTWIVLGLVGLSRLTAQSAPGAGAASCDSVLRAARADSIAVTARAYLTRRDGERLPSRARLLLAQAILGRFEPPQPLQLPVFGPGPAQLRILRRETLGGDSLAIRAPVVYGWYAFPIRRDGTVGTVVPMNPTMVPGFDERVAAAIKGAVTDSVMAAVGHALDQDSLTLDLRITTEPEDSRVRVPPATVFAATFPRLRLVDAKPVGTIPLPKYPRDELDDGGDGEALLRVVVDGSGAPLIPTIEVLHATSPAFGFEAAKTLARYHFTPAHVGACTVPQVVLLPFWFSLRP
jgi:hypothetical protein